MTRSQWPDSNNSPSEIPGTIHEKRTDQTRETDIALARKRLAEFLRVRSQKKKEEDR